MDRAAKPRLLRMGIVDDHPLFRVGLREALGREEAVEVLWDAGSAEEALRLVAARAVDVVLMDVTLKGKMDGITAASHIHRDHSGVGVVMMSAMLDERVLLAALRARAVGYLAKDLPPELFVRSVRALVDPSTKAPMPVIHNLLDRYQRQGKATAGTRLRGDRSRLLSPREAEVLAHVREGQTNREIAARLGVSRPTIDKHVQQILHKLQARNRAHAAAMQAEAGKKMVSSHH